MEIRTLGLTGIKVTELCFGALPLGPLQAKIDLEAGIKLIRNALDRGINFIDTAEMYQTYPYIKEALKDFKGEVVIASKSVVESYDEMARSIEGALEGMGRDYLDIFHLHAAKATKNVFEERAGALQCLLDYKAKGLIRAVGISTHAVEVVSVAAERPEIDVIFPIINILGMGIIGGTAEDMLAAIAKAHSANKGLYAMKALAGGHLINRLPEAYEYVRNIPGISSVAVGMVAEQELDLNLRIFNGEKVSQAEIPHKIDANKKLVISYFCKGCGACVKTCPNSALTIQENKATVDKSLCLLCGYCNPVCPEFAIRLA